MKIVTACLIATGLVLGITLPAGASDDHDPASPNAERALCHVCRVHEGEAAPEPVAASVEHDGTTYGFCSLDCRDKFLEDPVAYVPPVLPRPAPSFVVRDLDGAEVSFDAYQGKTVLLDFWATWCPPCIQDLPELTRLHERYQGDGLVVLSVSIDEGATAVRKIKKMIKRRKATHPVFHDSADTPAWASYHVRVVPTQYLIDAEGQIVAQWSGKSDLGEVEAAIVALLGDDASTVSRASRAAVRTTEGR